MVDSNIVKTEGLSTQCRVNHCSQCPGDTEFYCETCKHSLCLNCKESHVMSLDTLRHDVVIYREKFKRFLKQEICIRHPERIYEKYCKSCELPVCSQCENHEQHKILDINEAYETNRQQHKEIIRNIRSELLYISCFLQAKIHSDKKKLCKEIYDHLTLMSTNAQRIKILIDDVICDVTIRYSSKIIYRLLKQRTKIKIHLTILEIFDRKTEQHAYRSLEFLSFMKIISRNKTMATCILTKQALPSLSTEVNIEDLTEGLGEIQIIDQTGKRKIENKCLLKLMPTPVLQKTVGVRGISLVNHISPLTSERVWVSEQVWNTERVWVSDDDDIYLTNTAGYVMCHLTDVFKESWWGIHSVTSDGELIYIDREGNIDKLSADYNVKTTMIQKIEPWEPSCVHCSHTTGDLLVGTVRHATYTGKITRYDSNGQHVKTIQQYLQGHELYNRPIYVTENPYGDIIVTDLTQSAVVVTDHGGRHRFSYTGSKSEFQFTPYAICTDAFSHILVYDKCTDAVQMINKDGHFLANLLGRQELGKNLAQCLSYDNKTHLLWVGSSNNTLSVYRYIDREDLRTGRPLSIY